MLYLRSGIDEKENLSGTGWKGIGLKCKQAVRRLIDSESTSSFNLTQENDQQEIASLPCNNDKPVAEETNLDDCIYESIYDTESYLDPVKMIENELLTPTNRETGLVIEKGLQRNLEYNFQKDLDNLDEKSINNFIDKFKSEISTESQTEVIERERSLSNLSLASDLTIDSNNSSRYQQEEQRPNSTDSSVTSDILIDLDFRECCANSFMTDSSKLPNFWFGCRYDSSLTTPEILDDWKSDILYDLKQRNLKEHHNIDKISIIYENVTSKFNFKLNNFVK